MLAMLGFYIVGVAPWTTRKKYKDTFLPRHHHLVCAAAFPEIRAAKLLPAETARESRYQKNE